MLDTIQEATNRETCRACRLQAMTEILFETVKPHCLIEETFLFPALERHLDPDGPTETMKREHEIIEAHAIDIIAIDPGVGDREKRMCSVLKHLVSMVRRHIEKEETVLFPMARRILTEETMETLGAKAFQERHDWRQSHGWLQLRDFGISSDDGIPNSSGDPKGE